MYQRANARHQPPGVAPSFRCRSANVRWHRGLRPGALGSCARSTAGICLHQRGKSLAGGARLSRCPAHADCLGIGQEPAVTGFRGSLTSLRASRLRRASDSVAETRAPVSQLTLTACRGKSSRGVRRDPGSQSRRSLPTAPAGRLASYCSSCLSGALSSAYPPARPEWPIGRRSNREVRPSHRPARACLQRRLPPLRCAAGCLVTMWPRIGGDAGAAAAHVDRYVWSVVALQHR